MPDQARGSDPSALLTAVVLKSLTAAAESWARIDLTMPQLKVLLLLGDRGSVPVNWLASRMDVSPPNITGILDRLEQHHWVRRAGDPQDRRVVRIALTSEGERLLQDLSRAGVREIEHYLASLPQPEAESLRRGLGALLGAMERNGSSVNGAASSAREPQRMVNGHLDHQAARARV